MKKILSALIVFLIAIPSVFSAVVESGPGIATVEITSGLVQGYIRDGVYTFHGIPYAVANERFKPSVPVEHWDGVYLANTFGPISMQSVTPGGNGSSWEEPFRVYAMSESPLNLNVWTKGINDGAKRPIMVWLHGGGFSTGSAVEQATYDGASLTREGDVVVISVNHRLNVLGYLDLSEYGEEYKYSGNIGIMDLIDALKWIHENAAAFGGDPDNITLFGESGGGAKILALMESPYAKGLFKRGIVESGATEMMGVRFMDKVWSSRVAELTMQYLGLDNVEDLQNIPYSDLAAASDKALMEVANEFEIPAALGGGYGLSWEPVVDGDLIPSDPVTEDGFAKGAEDYGLLIGSNLTEWSAISLVSNPVLGQFNTTQTWSEEETEERLKEAYGEYADEIADEFLKAYPNKTRGDAVYVDFDTIRIPMLKIMNAKAKNSNENVYAYVFSWTSPLMNGVFSSYHTSEIPFVFSNIEKADTTIGGGDDAAALEKRMSQAWINYARTGNPGWEPYTIDGGATKIFDSEDRVVYHHDQRLIELLLEAKESV